jgi:hypothetical protein
MVDEITAKPPGQVRGRPFPSIRSYNLKRSSRCRPAAGAAEPSHIGQPQVAGSSSLHQTHGSAGAENLVTPAPGSGPWPCTFSPRT